ncbi:MAG: hypothetical protein JRG72_09720 [Deltaproteobacteria bacterium]|nr:hypothetical protein [Deltaproteobacteria bacterium]
MTVEPKPQIYYSQDEIAKLLSSESPIRAERRTYQPCLCARLQAGAGGARPLPGFELEVLRSAQEHRAGRLRVVTMSLPECLRPLNRPTRTIA